MSWFILLLEQKAEEMETNLVLQEASFLKCQGRMLNNLSPFRIVKNPDGS